MVTESIDVSSVYGDDDRKEGGQGDLTSLAANIAQFGQVNAIAVIDEGKNGGYKIIAGRRRLVAAKTLGWKTIRADIYNPDEIMDDEAFAVAENTARLEMHPLDEGVIYAKMLADGKDAAEIGKIFCRTKSQVYQRAKLGRLIPAMKNALKGNKISILSAACIAELSDDKQQDVYSKVNKTIASGDYVQEWELNQAIASSLKTEVGRDFTCAKCKKCENRTHYSDETLFPELEVANDYCFDPACYDKQWKSFVDKAFKKFIEYAASKECKIKVKAPVTIISVDKMPGDNGDGTVTINKVAYPQVMIRDAAVFRPGDTRYSEEEMAGYRGQKIVHGGAYWNGIVFEAVEYALYTDIHRVDRTDDDDDEDPEADKKSLEALYASLPDDERKIVVEDEIKAKYWDRRTSDIEARYKQLFAENLCIVAEKIGETQIFVNALILAYLFESGYEEEKIIEKYFPAVSEDASLTSDSGSDDYEDDDIKRFVLRYSFFKKLDGQYTKIAGNPAKSLDADAIYACLVHEAAGMNVFDFAAGKPSQASVLISNDINACFDGTDTEHLVIDPEAIKAQAVNDVLKKEKESEKQVPDEGDEDDEDDSDAEDEKQDISEDDDTDAEPEESGDEPESASDVMKAKGGRK